MAKLMPGVERFDVEDDAHWTAHVLIPLGLGGLRMKINFEKAEQREPEYAALHAKGQGVGALMNMQTQFHLSEQGQRTAMRWEADVRIAGPVGSMGQRVLQPIVNQQVQNVLNALDTQVTEAAERAQTAKLPTAETSAGPALSPGGADAGEASASEMGASGTPEPTTDRPAPETDPTLKDEGPPAEGVPGKPEGSSGAEEGVSPWAPEAYDEEPKGPTQSTEG
jgi:carbon monoxide dehydrogenase subunit G